MPARNDLFDPRCLSDCDEDEARCCESDNAPTSPMSFVVPDNAPSLRVDLWVRQLLNNSGVDVSRATVQRWISKGMVLVNDATTDASRKLMPGAWIVIHPQPVSEFRLVANLSVDVDIVYQDEHVLVINKPANLVVHPARGHPTDTLVNGLFARGLIDVSVTDPRDACGFMRPGIVHRLDKDTSGLLVIARTNAARENLKQQFLSRRAVRIYEAIVVGQAANATYRTCYGRHPIHRMKYTSWCENARPAITEVTVFRNLFNHKATYIRCRLHTGRTHQIRVHMSEQGNTPVLGDTLYGSNPADPMLRSISSTLHRHWLHARSLEIVHPISLKPMLFEQPAPQQLQDVLEQLKSL